MGHRRPQCHFLQSDKATSSLKKKPVPLNFDCNIILTAKCSYLPFDQKLETNWGKVQE